MLEALESRVLLSRTWFVSPSGNDGFPGTITQPFKTIQQAASLAQPGDTVYLRAGTYHETVTPAHSGTAAAPITYSAYADETVTIDGADPITGWTKYSGSIYTANQPWDLGTGNNELFVDGVGINEAAWPNTAVGAVQPNRATITSVYSSAIGTGWYYADTATISVSGLPGGVGAWNGATIHFGAGQAWNVQTGTVLASGNGTLTFSYEHQTSYETPVAGNKFYLTGKFLGLDAAGEWYRDPTSGALYVWTPKSDSPTAHVVEAKHRQYAFELSNVSYINVRNVRIIAASIDTSSKSSHISISGVSASYVSQQMLNPIGWINNAATTGIMLMGSNDVLQNSTINWSSGNGVFLGGSNNIVENCTITNTDYSGADEAAITVIGGNNQILSNLIHDTGRDGILDSNAIAAVIKFNTIYNIGHQDTDLGAIYDFGTDSAGSVIAYNTISSISTGGFGGAGVYLDNGSADFSVHNNTISKVQIPIKVNPPSFSDNIYSNTVNGVVIARTTSGGGNPAAWPATYKGSASTLVTLGTLGGFRSTGLGLNAQGQVVGSAYGMASQPPFLYSAGTMSLINVFGLGWGEAHALNNASQIVGAAYNASGHEVAFLDSAGKITSLGVLPGDYSSIANAVNSLGQIVGMSFGSDATASAFLYTGGVMKPIGTLGGSVSEAFAINDAGTVVGDSTVAGDRDAHAFAYFNGTMTNLGTLGGSSSYALAINKAGQIAGASLVAGNGAFHPFLYSGGVMHDIGTLPGYKNAIATGIDSAGDIVGYAYNTDISQSHAFLYRKGVMTDLNKLLPANTGWIATSATGINDNNQITGTVTDSTGRTRAFLLTILG